MDLLIPNDLSYVTVRQRITNSDLPESLMSFFLKRWVGDYRNNIFIKIARYFKINKERFTYPPKFTPAQIKMRLQYNKLKIENIIVDKDKMEVKFQIVFEEAKSAKKKVSEGKDGIEPELF